MSITTMNVSKWSICAVLMTLALCGQPAHATLLTAELSCVITGTTTCLESGTSFGTVELSDEFGAGQIQVTVNVDGIAGRFRDLMLNFTFGDPTITSITSDDGQASLLRDGFSESPYRGLFDIGNNTDGLHWHSDDAVYTAMLSSGLGQPGLTLAMFDEVNSVGTLNVYVHLQDLAGTGNSLKIGGVWDGGEPPSEIPEPATFALLGGGLIVLAWASRRRKTR